MPIYEYQCQSCGYEFDELQTMSEAPLLTCPNCGKDELKKLIGGGGGIIFKGSGFYQTDYKNAPAPVEDKTGKPKDKDTSGEKSGEKSDSKSEKSAEKSELKNDSKTSKTETKSETSSKPETKEVKKETKPSSKSKKK